MWAVEPTGTKLNLQVTMDKTCRRYARWNVTLVGADCCVGRLDDLAARTLMSEVPVRESILVPTIILPVKLENKINDSKKKTEKSLHQRQGATWLFISITCSMVSSDQDEGKKGLLVGGNWGP